MEVNPIHLSIAMGAGALSFLSPCVLPLLPAYLGTITGLSVADLQAGASFRRPQVVGRSVAFVLGLVLALTLLGATATAAGRWLMAAQPWLVRIAGFAVIILGLHTLGLLRIPMLWRQVRVGPSRLQGGSVVSAALMGAVFGLGWTPCIGPFLGSVLVLASQESTVLSGMALLLSYSIGLGLPFVLAAVLLGPLLTRLQRLQSWHRPLQWVGGILLILLGVVLATDSLGLLSVKLVGSLGQGLAQ